VFVSYIISQDLYLVYSKTMLQRIAASTFLGKRALSSLVTNNGGRSIASTIASSDQFIKSSKSCSSFKLPMRFSTSAMIIPEPAMLCRQCEQTKDGVACTTLGVCGKTPETSAIQDALLQVIKSVAHWCVAAREAGGTSEELNAANVWTLRAGFSTMVRSRPVYYSQSCYDNMFFIQCLFETFHRLCCLIRDIFCR
jgi:hypothetical protein